MNSCVARPFPVTEGVNFHVRLALRAVLRDKSLTHRRPRGFR
jgi:hypothetical protein